MEFRLVIDQEGHDVERYQQQYKGNDAYKATVTFLARRAHAQILPLDECRIGCVINFWPRLGEILVRDLLLPACADDAAPLTLRQAHCLGELFLSVHALELEEDVNNLVLLIQKLHLLVNFQHLFDRLFLQCVNILLKLLFLFQGFWSSFNGAVRVHPAEPLLLGQ